MKKAKKFKTVDLLSCSTGCLLGDFRGLMKVVEFLCGGPVHDIQLISLADSVEKALKIALPELPTPEDAKAENVGSENYIKFRDTWLSRLGPELELTAEFYGCLAVGSPIEDLKKLRPDMQIIVLDPGQNRNDK